MKLFELAIIGLMIALNSVFAAFEMALASISHSRLLLLVNQKKKGAKAAFYMKERMEASLAVVQLGVTLLAAIAAATGGASVEGWLAPILQSSFGLSRPIADGLALVLFVIPLSALTIVFAELVPKVFALRNKEWVCLALSPAMYAFSQMVYPVVRVLEGIVKAVMTAIHFVFRGRESAEAVASMHELRAAVAVARTARLIGAREEKILLAASQFPIRSATEIILAATDISTIPLESSLSEALIQAHLDLHTRFPVCAVPNDSQTIQGYVTFKDLVVALKMNPVSGRLKDIIRPLKHFPETASIADVLEFMIHEKVHIVLVESKSKRILGMITLEDILEEMVGDIEDEFDRLPSHIHPTPAGWIVGGGLHMDAVASAISIPWNHNPDGTRAPTLAEWCDSLLGRPIKKGETFSIENLSINVRKMRRRKLAEAFVIVKN